MLRNPRSRATRLARSGRGPRICTSRRREIPPRVIVPPSLRRPCPCCRSNAWCRSRSARAAGREPVGRRNQTRMPGTSRNARSRTLMEGENHCLHACAVSLRFFEARAFQPPLRAASFAVLHVPKSLPLPTPRAAGHLERQCIVSLAMLVVLGEFLKACARYGLGDATRSVKISSAAASRPSRFSIAPISASVAKQQSIR